MKPSLRSIKEVLDRFYSIGDLVASDLESSSPPSVDSFQRTYKGLCYESYSMHLADNELRHGGLNFWYAFEESTPEWFLPFVWIGAGWAFAKNNTSDVPKHFEDKFPFVDGMGFYHGLFKGRSAVKKQEVPDFLNPSESDCFDVGIGRSLWYSLRGDVSRVGEHANAFLESRRERIWEGVGVASHYVRGLDKDDRDVLEGLAGKRVEGFRAGAKTGEYYEALEEDINMSPTA